MHLSWKFTVPLISRQGEYDAEQKRVEQKRTFYAVRWLKDEQKKIGRIKLKENIQSCESRTNTATYISVCRYMFEVTFSFCENQIISYLLCKIQLISTSG